MASSTEKTLSSFKKCDMNTLQYHKFGAGFINLNEKDNMNSHLSFRTNYMHHTRKISRKYYEKLITGEKPWEIRLEDNHTPFHIGDTIDFTTCRKCKKRKGKWRIVYILRHIEFPWGLQPGYAILSLKKI